MPRFFPPLSQVSLCWHPSRSLPIVSLQERQPLHVMLLHVELAQLAPMLLFTGLPVELLGADKQLADRLQCQGAVVRPGFSCGN